MRLLKSQKQAIHDAVEGTGFSPAEFKIFQIKSTVSPPEIIDVIQHKPTKYYFRFEICRGEQYAVFSPGGDRQIDEELTGSWGGQYSSLIRWCHYLRREVEAADPWTELEAKTVSIGFEPSLDTPDTPFYIKERKTVLTTLATIEALLIEYANDNLDIQKAIKSEIKKLAIAAETQDRKTWFFTVVGFIASTAVSLALAPDQTKAVYEALKRGLSEVLKLI